MVLACAGALAAGTGMVADGAFNLVHLDELVTSSFAADMLNNVLKARELESA